MILSESDLERWGQAVGREIDAPAFLALRGTLGAGKSVLARAIARGAGVEGHLPSPTFNVLFRYPSERGFTVAHLDLYRLSDPDEVWELGWEEVGGEGEVALVEWPERAGTLLPDDRWDIGLRAVRGRPELREVHLVRVGDPPELPAFPLRIEVDG